MEIRKQREREEMEFRKKREIELIKKKEIETKKIEEHKQKSFENWIDTKTSFDINIQYFFKEEHSNENNKIDNISGILKLSLLKFISNIIKKNHLTKIKNEKLKKILQKLKKDLELINKDGIIKNEELLSQDIQTVLKEKEGNNIMEYLKYINSV